MKKRTTATHVVINAQNSDGSQSLAIKVPLSMVHFALKFAKLLPGQVKEMLDQELAKKGVGLSFDDLVTEGHEALVSTLTNLEIDVKDKKQYFKMSVT